MVPHLWGLEVANVLLVAERRGRISTEDVNRACTNLLSLPIAVDPVARDRALTTVLRLARLHGLTSYDAAYLELAIRHDLSIATLDAALAVAAESEGVERWRPGPLLQPSNGELAPCLWQAHASSFAGFDEPRSGCSGFVGGRLQRTPPECSQFKRCIDELATKYQFIDEQIAGEILVANQPGPSQACWVTFDDGYRDILTVAAPILTKYKIKPSLFLIPFLGCGTCRKLNIPSPRL